MRDLLAENCLSDYLETRKTAKLHSFLLKIRESERVSINLTILPRKWSFIHEKLANKFLRTDC